jgi:hypothetical protein
MDSMSELISTYEAKILAMKEAIEHRETSLTESQVKLSELEEKIKQKEVEGQHLVSSSDRQAIHIVIPGQLLRHVEQ